MIGSTRGGHAPARSPRKAEVHSFSIGQIVRMKGRVGLPPSTAEFYRITAMLPARDNSLQYRIRSDDERHERVATEDSLEAVDSSMRMEVMSGNEGNNIHGQGTEAQHAGATETEAGEGPAKG